MKGHGKLHHFYSTCNHNIFVSKKLSLKNSEQVGRFFNLDFRALPRFGTFWARDLKLNRYKLQSFVYHRWKLEEDILSSFRDLSLQNDTLKIRKSSISDRKWRHHKNIFGQARPIYTISENFMKIRPGVLVKSSNKKKFLDTISLRATSRSSVRLAPKISSYVIHDLNIDRIRFNVK